MKTNEILQAKREELKLSRKTVAEKLNISEGAYRDIEYGRIRLSLDNYLSICNILNISPIALVDDENIHLSLSIEEFDTLKKAIHILNKIEKQGSVNISENNGDVIIGDNGEIIQKKIRKG